MANGESTHSELAAPGELCPVARHLLLSGVIKKPEAHHAHQRGRHAEEADVQLDEGDDDAIHRCDARYGKVDAADRRRDLRLRKSTHNGSL